MMYFQTHLVVIAVVVVVLTAVVAYLCVMGARRLARLHQRILANRDALSRLLVRRASETLLLAREDALGRRAGACLTEVANASVADSADQLSCDGLDRRSGAAPAADPVDVRRCLEKASALSRAIRDTLDDDTRRQLAAREPARARLEALDATCYRIQLARSAHNTDVTQVRSLRGTALVRLFHLAGHAPEPEPIDFDDDTRYDGRGY